MPTIPPVIKDILSGAVRLLLLWIIAWFGRHNVVIPVNADSLTEGVVFVLLVLWMAWDKVKKYRLKNTQAALPAGATEADAKKELADGRWASAMTKADQPPVIKQNKPSSAGSDAGGASVELLIGIASGVGLVLALLEWQKTKVYGWLAVALLAACFLLPILWPVL